MVHPLFSFRLPFVVRGLKRDFTPANDNEQPDPPPALSARVRIFDDGEVGFPAAA